MRPVHVHGENDMVLDELFRLRLLYIYIYIYRHRNYPIVGENIGMHEYILIILLIY